MPAAPTGTVVNASEDVLDALRMSGSMEVPPQTQQDVVALVKTVYALTHTARLPLIHDVAQEVARELTDGVSAVGPGSEGTPESRAAAKVRAFWQREFSDSTAAGKKWRALVRVAHVETPGPAVEQWGSAGAGEPQASYDDVMAWLEAELAYLVCPC